MAVPYYGKNSDQMNRSVMTKKYKQQLAYQNKVAKYFLAIWWDKVFQLRLFLLTVDVFYEV
ncbi:MAG: hypothetical protein C0412_20520 [Flavobacterium sp.]|nr:hypothetical protein [Flavobacterium sp.]